MLENIKRGDICIFQNGDEATVIDFKQDYPGSSTIRLYFNKDVEGLRAKSSNWSYRINGTWLSNGNDIVKVIHR